MFFLLPVPSNWEGRLTCQPLNPTRVPVGSLSQYGTAFEQWAFFLKKQQQYSNISPCLFTGTSIWMIHWILLCYGRELDFLIFSPLAWYIFSFNFFCRKSVPVLILYIISFMPLLVWAVWWCLPSFLHNNMYIDYTRILLWCWWDWWMGRPN